MVAANATIFAYLDDFCASRGVTLSGRGKPRWIATRSADRRFIKHALKRETVVFSAIRKAIRLELDEKHYLFTVGFENDDLFEGLSEIDVEPSHLTVLLSDLKPKPKATPAQIKNVADADNFADNVAYSGHDSDLIAGLFPTIRAYRCLGGTQFPAWAKFFEICVSECVLQDSWIDHTLAETLRSVSALDAARIPYKVLCRSIFDGDPSSFFLALYRCIEALYAYSSAKDLVSELNLQTSWTDVAVALEDRLGWHPREEGSLEKLMRLASSNDLRSAVLAIDPTLNEIKIDNLPKLAASRIYKLRNSIVHYRPSQHKVVIDNFDWNVICTAMAGIVLHVYESVFSSTAMAMVESESAPDAD